MVYRIMSIDSDHYELAHRYALAYRNGYHALAHPCGHYSEMKFWGTIGEHLLLIDYWSNLPCLPCLRGGTPTTDDHMCPLCGDHFCRQWGNC